MIIMDILAFFIIAIVPWSVIGYVIFSKLEIVAPDSAIKGMWMLLCWPYYMFVN